jgi:hypothetical protein
VLLVSRHHRQLKEHLVQQLHQQLHLQPHLQLLLLPSQHLLQLLLHQ